MLVLLSLLLACGDSKDLDDTGAEVTGTTSTSTSTTPPVTDTTTTTPTTTAPSTTTTTTVPLPGIGVLSLNLHCLSLDGTAFGSNTDRFAAIATTALSSGASVLLLQEACERTGESAVDLLQAELESQSAQTWYAEWTPAHLAWQGTPDEAMEGLAILSLEPLSNVSGLTLAVQGGLTRVVLQGTLPSGLVVVDVHLDHLDGAVRVGQARQTAVSALLSGASTVLGGDLNDVIGSDTHLTFLNAGFVEASTGPAAVGIDHIFVHRGTGLAAVESRLLFNDIDGPVVSDHPGVLAIFDPSTPDAVSLTTVTASVDVGFGRYLSIRGDSAPIDWDLGWPMVSTQAGEWTYITSEFAADFGYKTLIDDATWQTGDNLVGTAGVDNPMTPTF